MLRLLSKQYLRIMCFIGILFLPVSVCSCSSALSPNTEDVPSSAFSSLLDDFFREYATADSLSLHYTIHSPELLQLEKPPVTLGHFSEQALSDSVETANSYLTRLHTFSRDTLEPSDRLMYDLLEYALENSFFPEEAVLYDSPLGPGTGLQTQLPVLLAEYRFSSLEDVEDYFLLLEDLPRYFAELCAFEQARFAAGTQACDEVLSRIVLQCNSFIEDPGNNFLIESFKDRLTALPDVTVVQMAELCIRNQKLVFTKVIPAYEQLIETLNSLSDTSIPSKGLCSLPDGTAYYEYLVRSTTGSDRGIEELEELLEQALFSNMLTMITLHDSDSLQEELKTYQKQGLSVRNTSVSTPSDLAIGTQKIQSTTDVSSALLQQLRETISSDFPAPADVSCHVESIHPSLEDFISPALYLVPPFDDYKNNVIYINRAKCSTGSLFSTLAHEGYPGHLYQNTFFAATSPHPARMLLNFTGYDEGWATYAELYSYRYADCSEELRRFLAAEQVAGLCLYSLSDIRIHYHGADLETIVSFLKEYGFSNESAKEVYYTQLAEPAVYLPYSVGYLEFCSLRNLYYSLAGDKASLLPFHTFVLETGPAPFELLREQLKMTFQ